MVSVVRSSVLPAKTQYHLQHSLGGDGCESKLVLPKRDTRQHASFLMDIPESAGTHCRRSFTGEDRTRAGTTDYVVFIRMTYSGVYISIIAR